MGEVNTGQHPKPQILIAETRESARVYRRAVLEAKRAQVPARRVKYKKHNNRKATPGRAFYTQRISYEGKVLNSREIVIEKTLTKYIRHVRQ